MEDETSSSDITISSKSQIDPLDFRICKKFLTSGCEDDKNCLLKHTLYIRSIVCKYFLHGYCYKGSECPYLHELIQDKLPECKNETLISKCANPECKYRHKSSNSTKECVFYNQGFCNMGKFCKFKHIRRKLCRNELDKGTCQEVCQELHLRDSAKNGIFEKILEDVYYRVHPDREKVAYEDIYLLCFRCMEFGHSPKDCEKPDRQRILRCYRCFEYGHKSNKCEKDNENF